MKSLKDLCCETIVKNIKFDNIDKLNVNEDCKYLIYIKSNEIYPKFSSSGLTNYQYIIIIISTYPWVKIASLCPIVFFITKLIVIGL